MTHNAYTTILPTLYVVTPDIIADLFVTAFEEGSTRWLHKARLIHPTNLPIDNPDLYEQDFEIELTYHNPYTGPDITSSIITPYHITKALEVLPSTAAGTISNIISEDFDTNDADVFLQILLFGEVIYS